MRLLTAIGCAGSVSFLLMQTVFAQSMAVQLQAEHDIDSGQYLRAKEALLPGVKTDPQNGALWFLLGIAYAQLKETGGAIEAFQRALPIATEKAPIYFNLGLLYLKGNNFGKSEDAYSSGLAIDASNVPANQNYAFVLMQQGKYGEAAVPLARLERLGAADTSTRIALIDAYLKVGSKSSAEREIHDLLSSHLVVLEQGLELAKHLRNDGETDAARMVLESLSDSWPTSAEVHAELGMLLSEKAQSGNAVQEFELAVKLDPDSMDYSVGLGKALIQSAQYPAALQFLQSVQKKFGDQPDFQFELALAYLYLLRFQEAIAEFENLARERPDSASAQFLLGGAYEVTGELQKAEGCYRNAIRLAPLEASYDRALGDLLQKQGSANLDEATLLLRRALAIDPSDEESKIVLARCLEKKGDLDGAAALLQQVISSNPASRPAHTALAQLYYSEKKLAQAEQEQSIATKLEDRKMREWYSTGPQAPGGPQGFTGPQ